MLAKTVCRHTNLIVDILPTYACPIFIAYTVILLNLRAYCFLKLLRLRGVSIEGIYQIGCAYINLQHFLGRLAAE
jgi:hypothetical protein